MKKEELEKFDGKDGHKAYVSNMGKVYDVTDSRLWKNGKHVNKHFAGMDLSEAIKAAPHGPEILERFAMVGELDKVSATKAKEESTLKSRIRDLYRVLHPHPIMLHFPMGLLNFAVMMQIIYFITGKDSFELAAFYGLCTGAFFMIPTMVSGFVSWWVNYAMTPTKLFKLKISFSLLLLLMCVAEIAMYSVSGSTGVYRVLLFLNIPVLGVIGFNGGKLSWG